MSLFTKIKYKMEISFFKLILARIKSKSPETYVKIRKFCGVIVMICSGIVIALQENAGNSILALSPHTISMIQSTSTGIGIFLSSAWGFSWLGTSDPDLAKK